MYFLDDVPRWHYFQLFYFVLCQGDIFLSEVDGNDCGRVKVLVKPWSWGNEHVLVDVGETNFDNRSAAVVCRELGLQGGKAHKPIAPQDQSNIWMDEVLCDGTEASLSQCAFSGYHQMYDRYWEGPWPAYVCCDKVPECEKSTQALFWYVHGRIQLMSNTVIAMYKHSLPLDRQA
jgi:hypothetical protein